jgi:hypothetical protein
LYFWRIENLKRELAQAPLASRQAVAYAIVLTFIFLLLLSGIETAEDVAWARTIAVLDIATSIVGIWIAYRANGGPAGMDFLSRLTAVSWVMSVRVGVAVAVPLLILSTALFIADVERLFDPLFTLGFSIPVWWRTAVHLRDVQRRTAFVLVKASPAMGD